MAWVITKLHASQSLTAGVEPSEAVLRTQFLVNETNPAYVGSSEDAWSVLNSIRGQVAPFNAIKSIGMRMEVQATDAYKAQLIVTDLQIEPHQERANCYIVSQTAKAPLVGLTPYRGLKVTTQSQTRMVTQYIRPGSTSFPPNGTVVWPPSTLITGGTNISVQGNPVQFPLVQDVVRVEFLVHEPQSIGYTNVPTNPASYVNTRNSATFLGFGAGQVLLQAYESRYMTDQVKMEAYTFVNDSWYHLEQVPLRNPVDGSAWNDTTISLGGSTVRSSSKVVWFQPYETTAAFDTPGVILPTEILNGIQSIAPSFL